MRTRVSGRLRESLGCLALAALAAGVSGPGCATARGQVRDNVRTIDTEHSKLTVRVFKSGFLSALAHNHEIEAPIEAGEVSHARGRSGSGTEGSGAIPSGETPEGSVELLVEARKLRVLDPGTSADTRAKVQETMLGPQVLDADRYPEIRFTSTEVKPTGADSWLVRGNLELHGQTRPATVDVTFKDGLYRGTAVLKQSAFGIKPISIAGGTVNVKDEVRIEFEVRLAK